MSAVEAHTNVTVRDRLVDAMVHSLPNLEEVAVAATIVIDLRRVMMAILK
jgi:hypothetical protein